MKRRSFILKSALSSGAIVLPWNPSSAFAKSKKLQFGLIADLHHDIMHDGKKRLVSFIDEAIQKKPEFILQMGDFCRPYDYNEDLLLAWNKFKGRKYHILGNHDMDGGFTRQQSMDFWKMKSRYYSFDQNGYHFIILDGNDPNPKPWTGYNRYINKDQQEWLKADLADTNHSTFIFSHQTIENEEGGVANFSEIRKILEQANQKAKRKKVVACFSGHHHTDYMADINGIYYIQINSASYRWVGEDYKHIRYGKEIDEEYPLIKLTIPYKDPLFTFVEIDPGGLLKIEPRSTKFVGPGPLAMGGPNTKDNDPIVPKISGFDFNFIDK